MLTSANPDEFVDLLYRAILRRAPDKVGRTIHAEKLRSGSSELDLIRLFIDSEEFQKGSKANVPQNRRNFVPLGAPKMKSECRATPSELSQLIERVAGAWTTMGTTCPYYSVL